MSLNLRTEKVPKGIILLSLQPVVPFGYSHECSLYGTFVKGVATINTNPGTIGGSDSHIHDAGGNHTHALSGGHQHLITSTRCNILSPNGSNFTHCFGIHSHTKNSDVSGTTNNSKISGSHTHNSASNIPVNFSYSHIVKTDIISLRQKSLPFNSLSLWSKPLSCIPSSFVKDTTNVDKFINTIATIGTTHGSSSGTLDHCHGMTSDKHSHISCTNHNHSFTTGTWDIGGRHNPRIHDRQARGFCSGGRNRTSLLHYHISNFTNTSNTNAIASSGTNSESHNHGPNNNNPSHITLQPIKKSIISMRQKSIDKNTIVMWNSTLASIPSCYLHADGTLCTANTIDKMIKPPTACPNTLGGTNTHIHSLADGTHTHNATINGHTHTMSVIGSGGTLQTSTSVRGYSRYTENPHKHNTSTLVDGPISCHSFLSATDQHNHSAKDIRPRFSEVAFIQKI